MIPLRELLFPLQPFWRRKKIETGLSEEIQSHLEMAIESNIAAGMSPREARYAVALSLRDFRAQPYGEFNGAGRRGRLYPSTPT